MIAKVVAGAVTPRIGRGAKHGTRDTRAEGHGMQARRIGQWTRAAAAVLLLAGCQAGTNLLDGRPANGNAAPSAAGTVERDVESPDVFETTEAALWDGRPSLGGVWVAHPAVTDPERVMIRNTATGASVVGALFRRERENPGPRLQLSSDAAAALGVLAGQPTEVRVVALRRKAVSAEPPADPEPSGAPEQLTTEPLDAAAAAIDRAEAQQAAVERSAIRPATLPPVRLAPAPHGPLRAAGPFCALPAALDRRDGFGPTPAGVDRAFGSTIAFCGPAATASVTN